MDKIFETGSKLALEQSTVIVRFDIQFNYATQTHSGYLWLANNHEYRIDAGGGFEKVK